MPHNRIGILAGGGLLPVLVRDACRRNEQAFHVIVFEGQGDPGAFADDSHAVIRLGAGGAAIKNLKKEGCDALVMAGTIRRPGMKELRPDWWGVKFFATSGAAALGDDGLLSALIKALENEGFEVIGADTLLAEYLMPRGQIGTVDPAPLAGDIAAALDAAKALGGRDIGQAAVVRDGVVVAEEDADGTDAMLRRLAESGETGGVLAKTLKPGQERRADLPTVGAETIHNARAAGLNGVVVEAGNAFLIDRDGTARAADDAGIFLLGADVDGEWR
ncbi:MAG: UDP-2,3-diacylglucosamine diphosphatase LpxI [Rhodospirillales bacterium]|nr:UDP-2,3-diacylglucosamine diphosphatase LpxI [Rhodospirillales bacterium]MBO6786745.1 UDP-2,3-diacylglucosamine diphosphatase LpxI [Rhodospirillales bacterium]